MVVLIFTRKILPAVARWKPAISSVDLTKYEQTDAVSPWRERRHCAIAQGFLHEGRTQFQLLADPDAKVC